MRSLNLFLECGFLAERSDRANGPGNVPAETLSTLRMTQPAAVAVPSVAK
jgi:hypothetical protein